MWDKQNIFESSGCLSREAFEAFRTDKLTSEAKAAANEHIASCPFCTDALEGFENMGSPQEAANVMAIMDKSFQQKYLKRSNQNIKKIVWFSISIAASLLLLSGLYFIFSDKPKAELAENTPQLKDLVSTPKVLHNQEERSKISITPNVTKNKEGELKTTPEITDKTNALSEQANDEIVANEPIKAVETERKDFYKEKAPEATVPIAKYEYDSLNLDYKKSLAYESSEAKPSKRMAPAPANYSAGKAKRSENTHYNDVAKDDESVPFVAEESASFQGGDINKFRDYVIQQIKISESVKITNFKNSKIIVQFIVDQKGKVTDIKILRSIDPAVDNEIIKIIKNSPRWTPGKQGGKTIKQQFELPVTFELK